MREMIQPMTNALPHLQPPKRVRGKAAEQDSMGSPGQPNRRRRCRVSDDEVEQIRRARLAGEIQMDQTVRKSVQSETLMPPALFITIPAPGSSSGSEPT